MADYHVVLRHVRYWRGNIHKWSTVYPFVGTASGVLAGLLTNMAIYEREILYSHAPGDGGLYQAELYNKTAGGMPIATLDFFAPLDVGAWPGYTSTAWDSTTPLCEQAAEVAILLEWQAGLSRTGKPVTFRKFLHSVPQSSAPAGTADVSTANAGAISGVTALLASAGGPYGLAFGNSRRLVGVADLAAEVKTFYANHQMPRGRKIKRTIITGGPIAVPIGI